jgi:hypothetical protein
VLSCMKYGVHISTPRVHSHDPLQDTLILIAMLAFVKHSCLWITMDCSRMTLPNLQRYVETWDKWEDQKLRNRMLVCCRRLMGGDGAGSVR